MQTVAYIQAYFQAIKNILQKFLELGLKCMGYSKGRYHKW